MFSNFSKKTIFFTTFFFLTVGALPLLPLGADEGPSPGDWEKRLKALEGRVKDLEAENTELKRQMGLIKLKEAAGVPAAPAAPAGLEDRVAKVEKALPSAIQVGHGTMKVGGLFQGWYVYDQDANDRFRIRRSEISLKGKIAEKEPIDYTIMVDPSQVTESSSATARKSILQDAFFTLGYIPHHTLDIGQYKVGIGEEGTRSSTKIDTIERAFISRTFGDQRDIGVRLNGKWSYLDYNVGVFNGSGQNQADANDQKDVAGRVVVRPLKDWELFKGFEVGASGYHRPTHGTTLAKKRLGYEARYEYKDFSLKGEYMTGQGTAAHTDAENRTLANGYYGQIGYYFLPKLQGVLKYEGYDPNEEASDDKVEETTVGLNYFIDKYYAKVQLNYIHKNEETEDEVSNDQVIGALQVAF
ncbi:MAG: hypothetical protein HY590_04580 [Candidatus Omnitrophica bacterium]|nr:hypothetical protein [Candidatus Omnitrophota bacterium]